MVQAAVQGYPFCEQRCIGWLVLIWLSFLFWLYITGSGTGEVLEKGEMMAIPVFAIALSCAALVSDFNHVFRGCMHYS